MASFVCSCGYEKSTSDSHVGRKAKCPQCGEEAAVMPTQPPVTVTAVHRQLSGWRRQVLRVAWLLLGMSSLLVGFMFFVAVRVAKSAMQEAAAGAVAATMLILGYVLARCVEKFINAGR